jgi:hypothetical protein
MEVKPKMRTRKLSFVQPEPPQPLTEEQKANRRKHAFEFSMRQINGYIHEGQEAQKTMIDRLSKPDAIEFSMGSIESYAIDMWIQRCWEFVLVAFEKLLNERDQNAPFEPRLILVSAIKLVADEITNRIMNDYDRPTSSSYFHNANALAKRTASCRFVERAKLIVSGMEDESLWRND